MANDKNKKYPWIKSLFKRKKRPATECVYAGPAEMNKRIFGKVYAGPPKEDPPEFVAVYAGPEYYEIGSENGPDGGSGEEQQFEDVYAGPEFFGYSEPDDEEPTDAPDVPEDDASAENGPSAPSADDLPEDGSDEPGSDPSKETDPGDVPNDIPASNGLDENAMAGVYAGPNMMPPPAPMMVTYAGPEFYRQNPIQIPNPGQGFAGPSMIINNAETEETAASGDNGSQEAGAKDDTEAEELAKRVAGELKQSLYCKVCGTRVHHGSPCCPNCGSRV